MKLTTHMHDTTVLFLSRNKAKCIIKNLTTIISLNKFNRNYSRNGFR